MTGPATKSVLVCPQCCRRCPPASPTTASVLPKYVCQNRFTVTRAVSVTRFWQTYFGAGLVKTVEDFGSQGEWPSHPDLLDWLATEFVRTGWDVKALHRLMVTSATYRQSSVVRPE